MCDSNLDFMGCIILKRQWFELESAGVAVQTDAVQTDAVNGKMLCFTKLLNHTLHYIQVYHIRVSV